ncbi:hypothetical protein VHEMI06301 [[Torrubiella] hemipterigena]|uniref:Arginine N-methyltransferase 2 n=1 Tax=[Torrubiella] hemipterigena TaxID=1531966 RepID=A0A0A1TKT9_9HYPO|nr:hypothetical protein VHEMI06301 [[Torrubiella] hemipterigena]
MVQIDDSLESRVSKTCPEPNRTLLFTAWARDLAALKEALSDSEQSSAQDPETGESLLHAAIRSCGPAENTTRVLSEGDIEEGCVEEAKEIVQELFFSGAIWNDVDSNNETPGCVALRLGRTSLYEMCVDAGVRAELLFALMDGYEQLSSAPEEMEQDAPDAIDDPSDVVDGQPSFVADQFVPPDAGEKQVTSEEYLKSTVNYDGDKLLDADLNGVMMAWETDIMRQSVKALLPDNQPGKRILNIGFGMGIIDGMFAETNPARHHIIEAHPGVLAHIAAGRTNFGSEWEKSGPEDGAFKVHAGRWQDIVPLLVEKGEVYDAIYFDTFGEDYAELRNFFTESIISLMDQQGRFSFFNGLGADRQVCYDVYAKVVEMQCSEAGLDVQWEVSNVDMSALDKDGEGDWQGVRRRYWTLNKYRLPICTFMG